MNKIFLTLCCVVLLMSTSAYAEEQRKFTKEEQQNADYVMQKEREDKNQWLQIKNGMSPSEVQGILGDPLRIADSDKYSYWIYPADAMITFSKPPMTKEEKVSEIQEPTRLFIQ